MSQAAWVKSEDMQAVRAFSSCRVDPDRVLGAAGVCDFEVDWERGVVYVPPGRLRAVAEFLGRDLHLLATAFCACGWTWKEKGEKRDAVLPGAVPA